MKKAVPEKKISKTKMDFAKELLGYSVAAGAALTIAHPIGAEVHYSGNQSILVDIDQSYEIDLDGDVNGELSDEFSFEFFIEDSGGANRFGISIQGLESGNNILFTTGPGPLFPKNAYRFAAYDSIQSIMPSIEWGASAVPNMVSFDEGYGNFVGVQGYIGVQFEITGAKHYGWIEYKGNADGTSGTILGWAYEKDAGVSISAGECLANTTYYLDKDGDGFGAGVPLDNQSDCVAPTHPDGDYILTGGDCDDNDPDEHPGQIWYLDSDGDGFGDGNPTTECEQPAGYALNDGDCDDTDPNEIPDQIWYRDVDVDGFGDPSSQSAPSCTKPPGYVADNTDCDDNNYDVKSSMTWYKDSDGDGFGDPSSPSPDLSCVPVAGFIVSDSSDCDDTTYNDTIEDCDDTLHQAGGGGSSSDDWYECFINTIKIK